MQDQDNPDTCHDACSRDSRTYPLILDFSRSARKDYSFCVSSNVRCMCHVHQQCMDSRPSVFRRTCSLSWYQDAGLRIRG